jgi:hypothetical protein
VKSLIILTTLLVALFALTGCGESTRTTDTQTYPMTSIQRNDALAEFSYILEGMSSALRADNQALAAVWGEKLTENDGAVFWAAYQDMTDFQWDVCSEALQGGIDSGYTGPLMQGIDNCLLALR